MDSNSISKKNYTPLPNNLAAENPLPPSNSKKLEQKISDVSQNKNADTNSISELPPELLREILINSLYKYDGKDAKKTMNSIVLTCKLFYAYAETLKFECFLINLDKASEMYSSDRRNKWCLKGIGEIIKKHELKPYQIEIAIKRILNSINFIEIDLEKISESLDKCEMYFVKICDALSKRIDLKEFTLNAKGIENINIDKVVEKITPILKNNKELDLMLDFSHRSFNKEGLSNLLYAIQGKKIDSLCITHTNIGKPHLLDIFLKHLKNMDIGNLYLSNSEITDESIKHMVLALPKSLYGLILDNNNITYNGIKPLLRILPMSEIYEVYLSDTIKDYFDDIEIENISGSVIDFSFDSPYASDIQSNVEFN